MGYIETSLCNELSKDPRYSFICPEDIQALIEHSSSMMQFGTCDDDECTQRIANMVKAKMIVRGSLSLLGDQFVLSLTMANAETMMVTKRATHQFASGMKLDKISLAIQEAVKALMAK